MTPEDITVVLAPAHHVAFDWARRNGLHPRHVVIVTPTTGMARGRVWSKDRLEIRPAGIGDLSLRSYRIFNEMEFELRALALPAPEPVEVDR